MAITTNTILLLLLLSFSFSAASTYPLVDEVCRKTLLPDLCFITFNSTGPTTPSTTLPDLAHFAASDVLSRCTNTTQRITTLLRSPHPPPEEHCLRRCHSNYVAAGKKLEVAVKDLEKREEMSVEAVEALGGAMAEVGACEEGCERKDVKSNLVGGSNMEFMNLCNNAMSIVKLLPSASGV